MARFLLRTRVVCLVVLTSLSGLVQGKARAQTASAKSLKAPAAHKKGLLYEDDEIKLEIPRGWRIIRTADKKRGSLLLEKNHYTLSLGYHTGQASGIIGGRFVEIFNLAWPTVDDPWACGDTFTHEPWPASRRLMFVNVIVDTGDQRVRENCGIREALGGWVTKDGRKEYVGDRRWFGGYFTGKGGFYFLADADTVHDCGSKAYTLTSQATSPEELPYAIVGVPDKKPELINIIEQAIDIVNSIHYKLCSPF